VGLSYDNANRRSCLNLPNGVIATYGYDHDSRVTSITYGTGGSCSSPPSNLGNLTYTYDADGRRTAVGGSLAVVNLPNNVTSPSYNADNALTRFAGKTLSYDANGNLTGDGTNSYTWDARNQLTAIAGTNSASFGYDALGRRVSKTVNGTVTQYLYDGLNPVQLLNGASPPAVTANLLEGVNVDEYFRTSKDSGLSFLSDALGSTLGLVNSSGAVTASYSYAPFGKTTIVGTSSTSFQFTGRENDGTGLYYYRARYYSSTLQRFISQDPVGFRGGDPNLYAYARNAPTVWGDALGWWIGQYPPPPPGYDPGTWGPPQQFPNGHWYLTDPSGTKWVAHPEDPGHWRHWDQQPPGGGRNRPWPPNSRKPRPNQNQCGPGQSATDPSGDAPDWQPPLSDPNSNMSVPVVPFDFPGLPPIEIPEIPPVPVPVF
jgi:RHS repeat-associated protein